MYNLSDKESKLVRAFASAYYHENGGENIRKKLFASDELRRTADIILSSADVPETDADDDDILDYILDTMLLPVTASREKYISECLENAVRTGTEQYVIIGGGYNLSGKEISRKIPVFDVDTDEIINDKISRIDRAGIKLPHNYHFISADQNFDDLKKKLSEKGFDLTKKTFFSLMGISFSMSRDEIRDIFDRISSFAAEGSTAVFDHADEQSVSSADRGLKFCCSPSYMTSMLEENNFLVYEELDADIIDSTLLTESEYSAPEHIRFINAVLKNSGYINTKERILHTALRLFAKYGYDAVSVRDISGKLGITQAALYKHYKNKQDIFDSILRRMEENDRRLAEKGDVPTEDYEKMREKYSETSLEKMKSYTLTMFHYWTENLFAADFRKMLTVEQYRSKKTAALYEQYLSSGPLEYTAELLKAAGVDNYMQKSQEFYGPVFMLMYIYDSSDNKALIRQKAENHLNNYKFM